MSSKPQNPTYDWLDLNMLPRIGHSFFHDTSFLLADNLREFIHDWENRPRQNDMASVQSYPIRLNFVMIQLCLEGTLDVQLNLKDYRLSPGKLLLVTPGIWAYSSTPRKTCSF